MKYMLLLYADPAKDPVPGTPEFDTMMAAFSALGDKMKDCATILGGDGLKGAATAKTLRVRSDRAVTTDGPFAETHEHLGGFYLIEAATQEDAMAFAAEVPVAAYGSVEVRPVEIYE